MSKTLHYFNLGGVAESIRYILHYTKQEFEDVRHDFLTWPDVKFKKTLPFGQIPIFVEGDKTLNQSLAIAKYVARDSDLIPADAWQQAILESTVYNIYDFWKNVVQYIQEKEAVKKEAMKNKILEETFDFFFSRFDKHLAENGGFFIGKVSWVEFVFVGITEATNLFLEIDIGKYPNTKKLVEEITHLPGVKEYIASRGPYKRPEFKK
ncbi:glutathione S-transferase-like isoform X4 [Trichoplusia ni]|uniref:glutathione transferase n=1 Tax=Trichoplusia ni TaxID=7111 RepID=A0A7E5VV62_TRINI|nr:glutathione S-transferase-like isoform X4 [Trichoplusia ni]